MLVLAAQRYPVRGLGPRLGIPLLAAVSTALAFFAYLGAWGTFLFIGQFPDVRAIDMLASDSVQLAQHALHMDPVGVATIAGISLVVGIGWAILMLLAASARPSLRIAVGIAAALLVAACVVGAAISPAAAVLGKARIVDPESGIDMLPQDFLAEAEGTRTGPLLRLRASLSEHSRLPTTDEGRVALAKCRENPIVPLSDYLRGVDTHAIHRFNVILLEVESLRTDQLVSFGGKRKVMPVVDALAAEGRVYRRHYTLSSHSNYADIPPLSSHYPLRSAWYHIYPKNPPYPRVLVYDILHGLGYRTAIISSQNEGWGGMANYLRTDGLDDFLDSGNYTGDTYIPRGDAGFEKFAKGSKRSGKVDDSVTMDRAMQWIDGLAAGQPFFLYMNLQNSHVPYETPASFDAPFPRPDPKLTILFNNIPRARIAEVKDAYSNSLAYVDSQIGRLVEKLRQAGRWDDTIVVIGGDNGEAFLEHGFSAHANALFDEVVHTPVIIRAPGLEPGVDDRLAATLDIAPSLLHLIGVPPHPGFQGQDLLAPAPATDRNVFLVAQTPLAHQYAIVRGGYKLIEDQRSGGVTLVDLIGDPGETRNLAKIQPQVADDLSRRLDLWVTAQLAYYGDPTLYCCYYPPLVPDAEPAP